ncbi:hypothetical protein GW750_05370 [bacterium]|nr:hypothetical protein [bacterium]
MLVLLDTEYADTLKKLDALYKDEKEEYESTKQKAAVFKDLEKRYENNKKSIDVEFSRIKSIVSSLTR